jgi:hypothetical protein
MTGTTISTTITKGITLSSASQNPVTITSGGYIKAFKSNSSDGIYGVALNKPWSIHNDGKIGALGLGIQLLGSGDVVNGSANDHNATIFGNFGGIYANGIIDNFATITSQDGDGVNTIGTLVNGALKDTNAYIYGHITGVNVKGLVENFGTILGGEFGNGVYLDGTMSNGAAADTKALVTGSEAGILLTGTQGNITNFGTIEGFYGINIASSYSGLIINGTSLDTVAIVGGSNAGISALGSVNVENFATVIGGIDLGGGGTVFNLGLLEGNNGIYVGGGTGGNVAIVNAGTIIGTSGTAIYVSLTGAKDGTLIADPGAVFDGKVDFIHGTSGHTVLELGSAKGSGTIASLGSQFEGFSTITFDAGVQWVVSGNSIGLAKGETITGFTVGDKIVLDGFQEKHATYVAGVGLELFNGKHHETIGILGSFVTGNFAVSGHGGNSTISLKAGTAAVGQATATGRMAFLNPAVATVSGGHAALVPEPVGQMAAPAVGAGWVVSAGRIEGAGLSLLNETVAAGPAVWLGGHFWG